MKKTYLKKSNISCIIIIFLTASTVSNIRAANQNNKIISNQTILDQQVYPSFPDWISSNPHYSTGAGLADINQDGWLDIVISDGNDMAQGRLNVYYNDGDGGFPTNADWQSNDLGYNGHLDIADVNGDGWPDVAVSYLGTSNSFGPIARLYLNNNGILSSTPDWNSDIIGNAFGVDFGDMNNDGRPDLAVATGWSYSPQHFYNNYVYLNVNGFFESSASWISDDNFHYMGVLWVDADDDGWLDLVGIGEGEDIQLYHNINGVLETTSSWQTSDSSNQDGIMLTAGDVNNDGFLDLFATDNTQSYGSGYFKQYNGISNGFFETTYSWYYSEGYGSAVALADVNGDLKLDLATGAWWDNTRIFLNNRDGLPTNPSWNSGVTSVIEKIVFGNVGPHFDEIEYIDSFEPDGDRRLFYLNNKPIQKIVNVYVDGDILEESEYTYSRDLGWITVNIAPTQLLEVVYTYSYSLDMVISNWDSNIGNYLYYNQLFEENLDCYGDINWIDIKPGSLIEDSFEISNIGAPDSELSWEVKSYPEWGTWIFNPDSGTGLLSGDSITVDLEIVAPNEPETNFTGEIVVENTRNPYDFCVIEVAITTPKLQNQINSKNNLIRDICFYILD